MLNIVFELSQEGFSFSNLDCQSLIFFNLLRIAFLPRARRTASGTALPSLALMVCLHSILWVVSVDCRLTVLVVAVGREVREGRESSMMEGGWTRLRLSAASLPQKLPARFA